MAERLYGPGHELKDATMTKLKLRRNDPNGLSWLVTTNVNNTDSIDCVVYNAVVAEEGLTNSNCEEVAVGTVDPVFQLAVDQLCPVAQRHIKAYGHGSQGGAWGMQVKDAVVVPHGAPEVPNGVPDIAQTN